MELEITINTTQYEIWRSQGGCDVFVLAVIRVYHNHKVLHVAPNQLNKKEGQIKCV